VPRVSVVLPVRNGERTLPAALESLRAQTEPDWELLAVDDGSTDSTAPLLRAWGQQDRRIRMVRTAPATAGIVAALNQGIALARAPLIARMDADDVADPRRLKLQCEFLDRHPEIGLVSCGVAFGDSNEAADGYRRHVEWLNRLTTHEAIWRHRFVESPLAHPSVVFRRQLPERHGGYVDGDFPEDYELWLRWLEQGVRMAKVPETLLLWNDSPHRLSRTSPRYAVEAFYRVKARYLARWWRGQSATERPLWIWGAGRLTRRRVSWLLQEATGITGWIDIDPQKIGRTHGARPVCAPEALLTPISSSPAQRPYVFVYVANWDAREFISGWLQEHGFVEEVDYTLCA
jgi:glycosyltransferase involved in cell wall biosynthesis